MAEILRPRLRPVSLGLFKAQPARLSHDIIDAASQGSCRAPSAAERIRRPNPAVPPARVAVRAERAAAAAVVPDLEKYERIPEPPGEYRHRMLMNGLGLAVTVALIVAGLWIADVMAHMRKDQDCVLSGRRNCAAIDVPAR